MAITQQEVNEAAERKGLVVREERSLVETNEPEGISGEADPSDFVIPYVKLVQATSEGDHKPGSFLSSNGEEKDAINMVVLHIARTRTFYDGDASKLLCSSNDRRWGMPRDEALLDELGVNEGQRVECGTCPHYADGQFQRLACKMDYAFTCFDLDSREPFLLRVKGTAMGVFKYRIISAVARGNKPPWFASFEMSSVKRTNERKQSWYSPELKPVQSFNAEEQEEWRAYAQQFALAAPVVHEEVDADDLPFE
jgi:hypothetical protein